MKSSRDQTLEQRLPFYSGGKLLILRIKMFFLTFFLLSLSLFILLISIPAIATESVEISRGVLASPIVAGKYLKTYFNFSNPLPVQCFNAKTGITIGSVGFSSPAINNGWKTFLCDLFKKFVYETFSR